MSKFLDGTGLTDLLNKIKSAFVAKADTATATGIDVDSTPTANSTNLVTSGGVKAALDGKQNTISDLSTIRSGASAGATAVQPAGLSAGLATKQDILTFDSTPTSGSTNPVTSGGVYQALQGAGTVQDVTVGGTSVVANKVAVIPEIPEAEEAQELGIDDTPTNNSQNLVKSGGVKTALDEKQATLISGTNIKTVNGLSLLGGGDIVIHGGESLVIDNEVTKDSANAVQSSGIYAALGKYGVVSQTQTWTGNASTGYTYTMSNQVWGLIPQANIDLYVAAGAVFNETTGYFELNGLTDISYNEMKDIYLFANLGNGAKNVSSFLQGNNRRTNISTWEGTWNQRLLCTQILMVSDMESFRYGAHSKANTGSIYTHANCNWMFQNDRYLRKISELNMENTTSATSAFDQCPSLEEVLITKLKISLSFPASSKLTAASVAHMINNVGTTNAITITLHATAYARAIADADVQAALAAHTNVSLASA